MATVTPMSNEQPDNRDGDHSPPTSGGWNFPALLIGMAMTVVMTIYPHLAARADGSPDMLAAALLFWSMSAGFVRGLGFIPRMLIFRLMFSLPASLLALAAATCCLALN